MGSRTTQPQDHVPRVGWPGRAIAELVDRQQSIITRRQLLALGVSAKTIARALRGGRLHRVHRGVYSVLPRRARPPLAAEHAALLATGPSAVLSHWSAAALHDLRVQGDDRVHVTIPGAHRRRGHAGVCAHQTVRLADDEHHRLRGLEVTSVGRTVVDLSAGLGDRALARLVDRALTRTSRTKLTEAARMHAGRSGVAGLTALLDPQRPSADTWSVAEERLLALIVRAGLSAPEANVPFGEYVPDLLWREQRVIVEFDSWAHHSGPGAFDHDRTRHNRLTAQGYQVIHVTWRQLTNEPERVLVWIAAALARS